jgi:hypothetical protein
VLGQNRILEDDDSPHEVDATSVHLPSHLMGVVITLCGASLVRQRDDRAPESDFTVLVLDVELYGVQAVTCETEVLVDLAIERGQRHRYVDAAHLGRKSPGLRLRLGLRLRCRRGALRRSSSLRVPHGEKASAECEYRCGQRDDREEADTAHRPAPPGLSTPRSESFVGVDRLEEH